MCLVPPLVEEGAGKAGCRLAPAVPCALALTRTAHEHTGVAGNNPAFPAAMGRRRIPGSPWGPGFLAPIISVDCESIIADLTPASGRQDHTVLPYALVPFVS